MRHPFRRRADPLARPELEGEGSRRFSACRHRPGRCIAPCRCSVCCRCNQVYHIDNPPNVQAMVAPHAERKRLPEQWIVEMTYLPDRKIVRNPPIHIDTLSLRNSSRRGFILRSCPPFSLIHNPSDFPALACPSARPLRAPGLPPRLPEQPKPQPGLLRY